MEESPQQQVSKLPLPPLKPTVPQFVNAQVMKDIATWAASEEAKAVEDAINQHCAEALQRDIVEADFKEFESRVFAQTDPATLKEWGVKLENALGVPHDLMERGREVMAAQMRTVKKAMRLGLEPVLGQIRQGEADRYRQMCTDLAVQIVLQGGKPPTVRWHVNKTNKSRSWKKNHKLGRHAERHARRWPSWHRRHKKWMRVAAKCGVLVWGETTVHIPRPAEYITLDFDVLPSGEVKFQ